MKKEQFNKLDKLITNITYVSQALDLLQDVDQDLHNICENLEECDKEVLDVTNKLYGIWIRMQKELDTHKAECIEEVEYQEDN